MIRVVYANYKQMDDDTKNSITCDGFKPSREMCRTLYIEVGRHKQSEFHHKRGHDLETLTRVYNRYVNCSVRSIAVGDIVELNLKRYILTSHGFEQLDFDKTNNRINKAKSYNLY